MHDPILPVKVPGGTYLMSNRQRLPGPRCPLCDAPAVVEWFPNDVTGECRCGLAFLVKLDEAGEPTVTEVDPSCCC